MTVLQLTRPKVMSAWSEISSMLWFELELIEMSFKTWPAGWEAAINGVAHCP